MDLNDLEPRNKKPEPKKLEEMSIEALRDYIAEMEGEIARARATIEGKQAARQGAESVFKR